MQTKFKRHQKVRLLLAPDKEYIEYHDENLENPEENQDEKPQIKKGMTGKINIILPNGQYHVAILNEKEEIIAYVMVSEDFLEAAD